MIISYFKSLLSPEVYIWRMPILSVSVLAIAYTILSLFYFNTFLTNTGSHISPSPRNQPTKFLSENNVTALTRQAWFGMSAEEEMAIAANNGSSSLTDYELRGVSQSNNTGLVGAYIAKKGQPDDFLKAGQALPDGAGILKDIFSDHVTIAQNGTLVPLAFSHKNASQKRLPEMAASDKSPFYALPPENTYSTGPAMSHAEIIKHFISNPAVLLAQAGLQPFAKDHVKGYVFNGEDSQGVFKDSGVQKDDIILAVNGTAVGDPKSDRTLAPKLALSHDLKLDIQRDGQHILLNYTVP